MENNTDFGSWPTEVLYSFFRSLDPLSLHDFSAVCKKWNQMSKDNELWRQFCLERWQNIPKESDCAKNWLIPVREGVGNKENRIDWRKVYLIRDLGNKAMLALQVLTPRQRRKNHKVAIPKPKDFFAEKGWLDPKDLAELQDHVTKTLQQQIQAHIVENHHEELMQIVDFHLEFELLMLQQVNFSRMKLLGFASAFLDNPSVSELLQELVIQLPPRLVATLKKYFELAVQKEVPLEIAGKFVSSVTTAFTSIFEFDADYPMDDQVNDVLQLVATIIRFINEYPYGEAYNVWISTDFAEDETSPTHEFEESLNYLTSSIKDLGEEKINLLYHVIQSCIQWINPSTSLRTFNTVLAVFGAVSDGLKTAYLQFLPQTAEKYVLPFFQVDQSTSVEKLVAINYYFSTIFSNLGSDLQIRYAENLLPGIIAMAGVPHARVQYHVSQMLLGFCEHLMDAEVLGSYLPQLLNQLFSTLNTTNDLAREKTIFAISSIVITCRARFSEVREGVISSFKNLLSKGNKKDREAVIEALSRIGAGIGDQKGSIADDVESLYAQVVEDFKQDRPAHEELLIKLTEFGITTMGKQFTKYLPIVFPVIYQHAIAEVVDLPEMNENDQNQNDNENDDNDNENDEDDEYMQLLNNPDFHVNEKEATLKTSCVSALGNLVEDLDREVLLPYYDQIHEALRLSVSGQGTIDLIVIASEIYVSFVTKFFPAGLMEPEWIQKMKPFLLEVSEAYLESIETEELETKERVLTSFNALFEIMVKNSPPDQPLLDDQATEAGLNMCYALLEQLYNNQERHIDELHDFGYEVVNMYEICCTNTANKQQFLQKATNFLGFVMSACMEQGPSESRWVDLCILTTTFEYYGDGFPQHNFGPILSFLWNSRVVDSKYTQQAIAYYLSCYARRFPQMLPPDLSPVFGWLETLMTKEYYAERPFVYDNALLAYGYSIERTTAQEAFMLRMGIYVTKFPPTSDGDVDEGKRCLETLARLLTAPQAEVMLKNPKFVNTVKKGLKAALEMEAYQDEATRNIVEPVIASMENILTDKPY